MKEIHPIPQIDELLKIIEGRKNRGSGLAHFKQYMQEIGNPHLKLSVLHVAGTNGKGSTVNYLRSILQHAGYKVGTFTSPYLETHRDRIRINDEFISEEAFMAIAKREYEHWMQYDLSMFEIDMAIASLYFYEEACDICIFEVGLGGRLDLTNIVEPKLCVITNIGMDHMEQLGDTYEKIAYEKAGIIKDHVPVITAEEKPECLSVFQEQCDRHKATLFSIRPVKNLQYAMDHITFSYGELSNIVISSGARYQVRNAACAIEAILQLRDCGDVQAEDADIYAGIQSAKWKGRFETVWQKPWTVLDGAHNEEGIEALAETLRTLPSVRILFAALKDKDTYIMMKTLLEISEDVTVTQFPFYRAQTAKKLAEGYPVKIAENFQQAILDAMEDQETPLIITGSLYFISQVREFLMKYVQNQGQ